MIHVSQSGPDAEADPDVDDNQEEPTDPAAAKPEVSDNIVTGVRALVPTGKTAMKKF